MAKRTLKASRPAVNTPKKPRCFRHRVEMKFDTSRMVWACPEPDCRIIAHPEAEVGGNKPISFEPPFEIMRVVDQGQEKFLLRKNKIFFDVTELVTLCQGTTGTQGGVAVTLWFPNIINVDGEGRPLRS